MKRILLFVVFMISLSVYSIDPSGARLVTDSSGLSAIKIIAGILGGIFTVVFGIPYMIVSLKSDKKEQKDFGCFTLVIITLMIIILILICG